MLGPVSHMRLMPARFAWLLVRVPRVTFLAAFVLAWVFAPSVAGAQTTTTGPAIVITNPMSLARVDTSGNGVTKRSTIMPEGINLQDCLDNLQLVFPITVTGFSTSQTFEVWGTDQSAADCTVATARTGATQTCYPITANFARTQTQSTYIGIKELIKGLNSTDTGADGCRRVNAYTFQIFFLILSGTDVAGSAKVTLSVDTVGPEPLSNVRVLPGNQAVTIEWDAVGEGGADDVIGAQAFCDPSPRVAGAVDAGTSTVCTDEAGVARTDIDASDTASLADAGVTCTTVANEGGTTGGTAIPIASKIPSDGLACSTAVFTPTVGTTLTADNELIAKYGCGSISGSQGSTIRIDSIGGNAPVNGTVYAIAVAAQDSFGNLGTVSDPICQFPEETSDFWRTYRTSGGTAGGGFCSIEAAGFPGGSFSLLVIGLVVGISSARRVHRIVRRRRNGR